MLVITWNEEGKVKAEDLETDFLIETSKDSAADFVIASTGELKRETVEGLIKTVYILHIADLKERGLIDLAIWIDKPPICEMPFPGEEHEERRQRVNGIWEDSHKSCK